MSIFRNAFLFLSFHAAICNPHLLPAHNQTTALWIYQISPHQISLFSVAQEDRQCFDRCLDFVGFSALINITGICQRPGRTGRQINGYGSLLLPGQSVLQGCRSRTCKHRRCPSTLHPSGELIEHRSRPVFLFVCFCHQASRCNRAFFSRTPMNFVRIS